MTSKGAARLAVFVLFTALLVPGASAQSGGDTRGLGDLGFVDLRPAASKTGKPAAKKKPVYKRAAPVPTHAPVAKAPVAGASEALVGVTLWRMRLAAKSDGDAARILVHEKDTNTDGEWTSERVAIDTPLGSGQRVRLSIETPREGYLYVIDREIYADGSTSPAFLIFPTTRTRGGDNKVGAGSVVEIPGAKDNPIYFTARRSRPDQVSEALTVIVSPTPLGDVSIKEDAQMLDNALVATWERQWGGSTERLELEGGVGTLYTAEEKAAGESAKGRLDQDDPVPQTVFRISAKTTDPVLVTFPLKLR